MKDVVSLLRQEDRVVFHLDMDAFYASVEQRDHPHLRGKPVIVGGPPTERGVVCAASYEARRFGVRSAMPSVTAGRLCPRGIFVPVRMERYKEESREIMGILARVTASIERMSIDEAYLDVTDVVGGGGGEVEGDALLFRSVPLAKGLREQIRVERHLTASIGIASNKFLAKMASDFQKPDGLTLVPDRDKVLFLRPMPVRVVHGVGRVTEQELHKAGLRTVGDLQDYKGDLRSVVGSFGERLRGFAHGVDDRRVEESDTVKSISSEETFRRDTEDRVELRRCLREQAAEIALKLKQHQLGARTVQVKVRYGDFTTVTRQLSLEDPVVEAGEVYRLGCFLLGRDRLVTRPLRLLGLGVSGLGEPAARQLTLL